MPSSQFDNQRPYSGFASLCLANQAFLSTCAGGRVKRRRRVCLLEPRRGDGSEDDSARSSSVPERRNYGYGHNVYVDQIIKDWINRPKLRLSGAGQAHESQACTNRAMFVWFPCLPCLSLVCPMFWEPRRIPPGTLAATHHLGALAFCCFEGFCITTTTPTP